jgi:CheY-like chemotaxis protein
MTKPIQHVLVVEDDPTNRVLLGKMLERHGFSVTTCSDGASALALVVDEGRRFEVIVMDLMMRDISGLDATREIRATPQGRDIRILCVTAQILPETQADVEAAGCDGMLRKPFRSRELLQAIEALTPLTP